MTTPELLPCPFCGAHAEMWDNLVCCSRCLCALPDGYGHGGERLGFDTETEAIAAWNTRAPLSPAEAPEVRPMLAELPEVKRLVEEAVWAVAQVADKELDRWGFATGPDGFGRRAEMRNAIAEELPSVKAMRSTAAAIRKLPEEVREGRKDE